MRQPLFGGRVGAGLSSRRIFIEASYQKVWVDGASMAHPSSSVPVLD
jgi:hypothetical protein